MSETPGSKDNVWRASAYYADGVTKRRTGPRGRPVGPVVDVSRQFAIEVWAGSRNALQMDLDVFESREDIGAVHVWFGIAGTYR